MKKNLLLSILSLGILAFVLTTGEETAHTFSGTPPGFNASAPGQSSCANAGCHDSNTPNSGEGSVSIGFADGVAEYEAGEIYAMSVTIEEAGAARFGFQLCALNADGETVGTLNATGDNTGVQSFGGVDFVNHMGAVAIADEHTYNFEWTAPSEDIGDITFYATGLAANGNGSPAGDNSYSANSLIRFKQVTSSNDVVSANVFNFYPNPVQNELTVSLPNNSGTAALYTVDGKVVANYNLQQGNNSLNINANTGVYLLSVTLQNGETYTKRLMVQ